MVYGKQMVWNLENMVPRFSDYESDMLPLKDTVFNRTNLFLNPKSLVRPEEDYDKHDIEKNDQGRWAMDPGFN